MLDVINEFPSFAGELSELACEIEIPTGWDQFFQLRGQALSRYNERRATPRFHLREAGALRIGKRIWRTYTVDLSRGGLALLHSEQLFPESAAHVWLPPGIAIDVTIESCVRYGRHCYHCGGRILSRVPCPSLASFRSET